MIRTLARRKSIDNSAYKVNWTFRCWNACEAFNINCPNTALGILYPMANPGSTHNTICGILFSI